MALGEQFYTTADIHPIDLVEHIAEHRDWEFDRVTDDQISMVVEGQWRTYSLTIAWSAAEQTLRLISTFDMEPPQDRHGALYECINRANDMCWAGAFTFWNEQNLMVWRYGLVLTGDQIPEAEQIDTMINAAVNSSERLYPAFQLVAWTDRNAAEAIEVAIGKTFGRA